MWTFYIVWAVQVAPLHSYFIYIRCSKQLTYMSNTPMVTISSWKQIETIIPTNDVANIANINFAFRLFFITHIAAASTNNTNILSDIAIADVYTTHCSILLIVLLISNIGETLHFLICIMHIYIILLYLTYVKNALISSIILFPMFNVIYGSTPVENLILLLYFLINLSTISGLNFDLSK